MHPNITKLQAKFPDLDFSEFEYRGQLVPGWVGLPSGEKVLMTYKGLSRSKKGNRALAGLARKTTEQIIQEISESFDVRNIDFSESVYRGANTTMTFICTVEGHGRFERRPGDLLAKKPRTPCPTCNRALGQQDSPEDFWEKGKKVHPEKDEFVLGSYFSSKEKAEFKCLVDPEHGSYFLRPNDYLNGRRCQKCSAVGFSSAEKDLADYLRSLGVEVIEQFRVPSGPGFSHGLRPDLYIPEKNLIIDYHGLYFHSEEFKEKDHMVRRLEYLKGLGFSYIQIMEDEWVWKRNIVEQRLKSLCGRSDRVFARKTQLREISVQEANHFLENTHLQGGVRSTSYAVGLFLEERLVSVATFGSPRVQRDREAGFVELLRFASFPNVVGGFTKLLSSVDFPKIVTYSDRRWGEGRVYEIAGFTQTSVTVPGYFWCKGQRRFNRMNFQKYKLKTLPEFANVFSEDKTEVQMCQERGYSRVHDAGHIRWEKQ